MQNVIIVKHVRATELLAAIYYGFAAAVAVILRIFYCYDRFMYILRFGSAIRMISGMVTMGIALTYYCYLHRRRFYSDEIDIPDISLGHQLLRNQSRIRLMERLIIGGITGLIVASALLATIQANEKFRVIGAIHLMCDVLLLVTAIYLMICSVLYIRMRRNQYYLIESVQTD